MRIRYFWLLLLSLIYPASVFGQDKDFGVWYEIASEKSLGKKFELDGSAIVRTFNNASEIDQTFFELGTTYKMLKHLHLAVSYRIGSYLEDDEYYHLRHKWFTDLKTVFSAGNFDFYGRFRFQVIARTWVEEEGDDRTEYDGRIKLKVGYNIRKFPVDPYISFETFTPLFNSSDRLIDKSRSAAGLEYKISKKHSVNGEYIYQQDNSPNLKIMHIAAVSYNFKF